jgi:hypothetical protein
MARIPIPDDLDKAIASLEKTLNSGAAKILLTELAVQVSYIPEEWIEGHDSSGEVAGLDVEHIMRLGGWESLDMVLCYTRLFNLKRVLSYIGA